MNKSYSSKKGFSLIIAMTLVILFALIAQFLLEYMIPFSRQIKGVENSSKAYYQASSSVENALYDMNKVQAEQWRTASSLFAGGSSGNGYGTTTTGSVLPESGEGESIYDSDWNSISPGSPIQLEIGGYGMAGNGFTSGDFSSGVEWSFRLPKTEGIADNVGLQGAGADLKINWVLSSENDVLYAKTDTTGVINVDKICDTGTACAGTSFSGLNGVTLGGTGTTFEDFYLDYCVGASESCTLRFSIIDNLNYSSTGNPIVPYIEWKFDFSPKAPPLRYSRINAEGYSYGFRKDIDVKVPQQTINEAFDFTIFQ